MTEQTTTDLLVDEPKTMKDVISTIMACETSEQLHMINMQLLTRWQLDKSSIAFANAAVIWKASRIKLIKAGS